MKLKIGLLALLLIMVLMCPAAVMGADMTALDAAGSGATIVASATAIELVSVDPDVVTTTQGVTIPITITAEVFAPNGIGWIECVVISNVEPQYFHGSSLPIAMGIIGKEEIISARYEVTIDILCCQPVENYTVTVTVADKDGNTATGTATFAVEETLAIAVTDVKFGSVATGKSSEASSTVTNLGNVRVEFKKKDGIVPSDMHAGGSGIIKAENIAVDGDWKTVIKRGYFSPGEKTKEVPFTLSVPYGTPPGTYTGRITFTPMRVRIRG